MDLTVICSVIVLAENKFTLAKVIIKYFKNNSKPNSNHYI